MLTSGDFFIKIITTFLSVIIVLIDQVYERSVHFSPVALCSRYLQTAIYCLLSVGISFSYFLSRASIQWKCEQVTASIISTVQLFTACITCSKIFMSPPPQDQVLNSMVYLSILAKFCSSFTPWMYFSFVSFQPSSGFLFQAFWGEWNIALFTSRRFIFSEF